jgi:ABC-type lipoprotein export system ATPase subunit
MIKLENITKIYKNSDVETVALKNINLEIKEGEFCSYHGTFWFWKINVNAYTWLFR